MAATLPDPFSDASCTDALRRLLSLADFERVAGTATPLPKNDLARMRELADRHGHPERGVPVVHVAGTKGKGSTAAMISSILVAAGRRVGLFTSPHLHTFRERLRVNGEPLTERQFARALGRVWPHVVGMENQSAEGAPTTFEVLTAMAFDLPRSEQVDVLVLEVGLGGRLDSTNVAEAAVDVITSLSLDHTAILGSTLAEVAAEKAGIVKSAVPVVVAPQKQEAIRVVEARAASVGARLQRVGTEVRVEPGPHDLNGQSLTVETPNRRHDLWLPLLGAYQAENAALAVAAVEALDPSIGSAPIAEGVRSVRWDGRFQVLAPPFPGPCVVVDGAHNPYSIAVLRQAVGEYLSSARTVVVFGCSVDKELQSMAEEIGPLASEVVVCASRHPRSVTPELAAAAFRLVGVPVRQAPGVQQALDRARALCGPGDLVLVTGSLFVVAEALEAWHGLSAERYPELDTPERVVDGSRI